jgi:hypothetical protein
MDEVAHMLPGAQLHIGDGRERSLPLDLSARPTGEGVSAQMPATSAA